MLQGFRTQQILVVSFNVLIFWHSFFAGAPRSDQIGYLHQVSQYTTLGEILWHAPAWNRTHSAGDSALFRPVLYFLLGLEYSCFGYHFMLWQALAIGIHSLIALVLLAILWKTPLRTKGLALGITCLFASSYIGSEMVIWNHITGYALFCLMAILSVYTLLTFLENGRNAYACWAVVFAGIAVFTYELGIAYCVLAATGMFWPSWMSLWRKTGGRRLQQRYAALGAAFLVLPILYVEMTIANYHATSTVRGNSGLPTNISGRLGEGLWYTVYHLRYWAIGWLSPVALKIAVGGRAYLAGFQRGWTLPDVVNYAAILLLGGGALASWFSRRYRITPAGWLRAAGTASLLVAYSAIISLGRSLDRGLAYTITSNLYYAYIPALGVCLGFALLTLNASEPKLEVNGIPSRIAHGALATGMITLVILNGWYTYRLCREYRLEYSAPRVAIIERILDWREHHGTEANAFFQVSADCSFANDPLPWFAPHVRRGARGAWSGPFFLADALFPEKSFELNKQWLHNASTSLTEIPCPFAPIASEHVLVGEWSIPGGARPCTIRLEHNALVLTNENGVRATGSLKQNTIFTSWGIKGRLGDGEGAIRWSNGTVWFRIE